MHGERFVGALQVEDIEEVINDELPGPIRARLLARLAAAEQPARDPMGPVTRASSRPTIPKST